MAFFRSGSPGGDAVLMGFRDAAWSIAPADRLV